MRHAPLGLLLLLCMATDLALRPLVSWGGATPDPPLLLVLWLAHSEPRARVHGVLLALVAARVLWGIDGVVAAWLPAAIAVELVLLARRRILIRDPVVRLVVLSCVAGITVALDRVVHLRAWQGELWSLVGLGTGLAALWGLLLFPILDATRPILHHHDRPT